MKRFSWNKDKNKLLRATRQISFEDILFYMDKGFLLDIQEHPNQEKYPNQRIFVVQINNYAYLVPFVEDEKEISLKTIIPSRKATKKYLGDKND